ncbi:MAG: 50S ribosomal protein L21 [Phycisphaerae bacterium]
MYAVISNGGHQYCVEEGLTFEIERREIPDDSGTICFDRVLMVGDLEEGPKIGTPIVEGAKVTATVLREVKGDKITVHTFRRRKNSARKRGHRQRYLHVKVDRIEH